MINDMVNCSRAYLDLDTVLSEFEVGNFDRITRENQVEEIISKFSRQIKFLNDSYQDMKGVEKYFFRAQLIKFVSDLKSHENKIHDPTNFRPTNDNELNVDIQARLNGIIEAALGTINSCIPGINLKQEKESFPDSLLKDVLNIDRFKEVFNNLSKLFKRDEDFSQVKERIITIDKEGDFNLFSLSDNPFGPGKKMKETNLKLFTDTTYNYADYLTDRSRYSDRKQKEEKDT